MSLPAGQQRVLDSIEDALRAAEPKLASMFAIFARLTRGEARPAREELPDRRSLRSWSAASRQARALRRARSRRPLLRLLFIGQLMAILAVLGLLIGFGASMTPAACASQAGVSATGAHSRVVPAACRGGLGK